MITASVVRVASSTVASHTQDECQPRPRFTWTEFSRDRCGATSEMGKIYVPVQPPRSKDPAAIRLFLDSMHGESIDQPLCGMHELCQRGRASFLVSSALKTEIALTKQRLPTPFAGDDL